MQTIPEEVVKGIDRKGDAGEVVVVGRSEARKGALDRQMAKKRRTPGSSQGEGRVDYKPTTVQNRILLISGLPTCTHFSSPYLSACVSSFCPVVAAK